MMTHGRKQSCLVSLCKSEKAYVGQQSMYRMSCKLECNALHIVSAYTRKHSSVLKVLVKHCVLKKKGKSSSKE